MKFNLNIGEPIKKLETFCAFKIVIHFEHGDADMNSTGEVEIDSSDKETLDVFLNTIEFVMSDFYPPVWEKENQKKALSDLLVNDERRDWLTETLQVHDCTDQGFNSFAKIQYYDITYFDMNGIEYDVELLKEN